MSDTIYKPIFEDPWWNLVRWGDTSICGSGTVNLSASGAEKYLWDNGNTNDTISVSAPGIYTVIATNPRGCEKSITFTVSAYLLPATEFSFLPDVLDRKNYSLECNIPSQTDVMYSWMMGDGSSYGPGSTNHHDYNLANDSLFYLITLVATDAHNCTDTSIKYVDVIPFIPNVFTPDGDGINDVFMPDFDLEIVDRNGMKIYKGNGGWDGRKNDRPADPDTYFYLINYKNSNEKNITRKGYLTLVR